LERKDSTGPRPIQDALRQLFRQSHIARPAAHERVLETWSKVAGPRWRTRATPVAFRSGALTVEVASSVALQELRDFQGEGLRTQANRELGGDLIHKVVFKLKGRA
jgi:predicted nucleic acid-binding Zn ribbon protein